VTATRSERELAGSLRQWRDRIRPESVGLPINGQRRSPGLRREELALLAGLSADYVTRLEQGRSSSPSVQVLTALARALRLSKDERDYLFQLAGQAPPGAGRISAYLPASVERLLDRLTDTPVAVFDAAWTQLAENPPWTALMGDISALRGRDRNLPWRHFVGDPSRVVRPADEIARFELGMVSDLRGVQARYPLDDEFGRLIADLIAASPRFAELWQARTVATHSADRKEIDHPEVGKLTLDCDVLTVQGSDLRIIAYTAEPDSEAAEKLALLRVIGLQQMKTFS
jgi:transcriptional regulator with XRE-family HTH domain